MNPTVVCVLRSGGEYTMEHVRILYGMIRQWWPRHTYLRFVCLSDVAFAPPGIEVRPLREPGLHGWWAKLELFAARHDDLGHIWYFDLDTLVIGSLLPFLTYFAYGREHPNRPILLEDFYKFERVNSGLMYLPKVCRPEVQAVLLDPDCDLSRYHGDGDLLHAMWHWRCDRWQSILPDHVISYKVHVRRMGLSAESQARIICFHGKPRPWHTTLWAQWATPLRDLPSSPD